jgi:hypothetical protein
MILTGEYSVADYEQFDKDKDKNIFENIIESMILDGIAGMNDSFKQAISSLPKKDKRLAILSLLDKDRNLFAQIKESMTDINLSKIEHVKNIILMLREYVKIAEVEKKKFGEVMTPLDLVKEMLSTLPKEVWSNPNLKWLDPANGTGPFPAVVIYKLMKGLESWEPDAEKRYKHIIENMIYVCEIQPKNMFLYLCTIDPKDEYDCNIYTGSFLEEGFDYHMKNIWNVDKFDIIIGNPPYNTGTSGGNGARDLWDKFLIDSIDLLNKEGYLVFVHPTKWRSPENKIFDMFKKINLIYLEIHSKKDGKKIFGATTRYDFYCVQNIKYNGQTTIKDEKGVISNINILEWNWLPNYNFNSFKNILSDSNNCNVIYSRSLYGNDKRWMTNEITADNNLPCVYGMYKDYTCSYKYSSIDRGHFGVSKVILGLGEFLYPFIDLNGEYGIMNNAFGLEVDNEEEALGIKHAIETDEFKEIIKSTKWSNFQTNYKMFKSFKKDFWKEFI